MTTGPTDVLLFGLTSFGHGIVLGSWFKKLLPFAGKDFK